MAEIKKVRYSQDRTINLGNYESVKVGYGMTAELDGDDDPEEVVARIKEQVGELIEDETKVWNGEIRKRNRR